ncbi:MAG: hypothetical protein RIC56_10990 [Pseudomonadales bacterium]
MTKCKSSRSSTLALAIGATLAACGAIHHAAADSGVFKADVLDGGYMLAAAEKTHEGKCGEGKCGGDKSSDEGKCGEGKCGGDKSSEEGKCGEGKCGGNKTPEEGKCGEGKCGGAA